MAQGKEIGSIGLGQDPSNIAADGLTRAQSANSSIVGVAGVGADGSLYGADGTVIGGGGSLTPYKGVVGNRSALPDNFTTGNTQDFMKSTSSHVVLAKTNQIGVCHSLKQAANGNNGYGSGYAVISNFITIRGVSYWLNFSGNRTVQINYGEDVESDLITLPFTLREGERYTVTQYLRFTPTSGNNIRPFYADGLNYGFKANAPDACQTSSTELPELVLGETVSNNAFQGTHWRPFATIGMTTKHTAGILGDSRQRGSSTGTLWDFNGDSGEVAKVCARLRLPYVNLGTPTDSYFNIVNNAGRYDGRNALLKYATMIIDAYGINDVGAGSAPTAYTCASSTGTSITGISPTSLPVGAVITGTNIRYGTYVTAKPTSNSATLNQTLAGAITSFNATAGGIYPEYVNNAISVMKGYSNIAGKPYFRATMTPRFLGAPFTVTNDAAYVSMIETPTASYSTPNILLTNQAMIDGRITCDGCLDLYTPAATNSYDGLVKHPATARKVTDAAITSGSSIATSATAAFTPDDNGRSIRIAGAGAAGVYMRGIIRYINATTVQIVGVDGTAATASTTVTGATCYIRYTDAQFDGLHFVAWGENNMAQNVVVDPILPYCR